MMHVCDDFFNDPYHVRGIALKQKYITERFNYPGVRSFSVPDGIGDYILSYVKYILKKPFLKIHSQCFQSITKKFGYGIFHQDQEISDDFRIYTCINYLSLDTPLDSGTEVCDYDHPYDNLTIKHIGDRRHITTSFHSDPSNLIKRYRYGILKRKVNSFYKPIVKVPNKFNRFMFFPGGNIHRAQNFFGNSLKNSRLTIVSFIME